LRTRIYWALATTLAVAVSISACARATGVVPPIEQRTQRLNEVIMCPVCPGESIDQSQNTLAGQMRVIVREKLEQGWEEEEIKAFFVERYGPSVLLEPPTQGVSLVVWLLPPVAVVTAGLTLYLVLRLMRQSPHARKEFPNDQAFSSDEERDEYFRRVEAASELDGGVVAEPSDAGTQRGGGAS